jgi:hypothetical protein
VCKAPGATLAPPSYPSYLAFSSLAYRCCRPDKVVKDRPAKIRPVRTLISIVIVFSRGNAATLTSLSGELNFPTAKGGSQHKRASMPLRVYALLTTLLALLLPRRSLSCVSYFAHGQFFPLHVRLVYITQYIWNRFISATRR